MTVIAVVEGDADLPIVRKLAEDAGLAISLELDANGKDTIDRELVGYNGAAKGSPWLVLRDLDHDAACAPNFLIERGFSANEWMCFRLAVREAEAWLLADDEAISEYFRVKRSHVPVDPDAEPDPKRTLVELARGSRSGVIKRAMLPRAGASVGPEYVARVIEFGSTTWDLGRACARSPSLRRGRAALRELAHRWRAKTSGPVTP